jgi:hypothetical protein
MKNKITNTIHTQFTDKVARTWKPLLMSLIVLGSAGICQASVREEVTGVPFYARGADTPAEAYTDGETAVITFYRDPTCIPADFNLMDFYYDEIAPDCASCVAGFDIWDGGPGPRQLRLKNTGPMAIWFVNWTELLAAQADGKLTIGELASLDSLLKGTATFYTETLHPYGVANRTLITVVASGSLEDGRSFTYQITGNQTGHDEYPEGRHIKIEFK